MGEPNIIHPSFCGQPILLGDQIRISNPHDAGWMTVTEVRWIEHEGMAWIHCGSGGSECITDVPTDGYSHVLEVRRAPS